MKPIKPSQLYDVLMGVFAKQPVKVTPSPRELQGQPRGAAPTVDTRGSLGRVGGWAQGAARVLAGVMAFVAGHAVGNGAVCWVIISEIFPNRIRGAAGTTVTLHIERPGAKAFDVTITRAKVQRKEVITKDLAGGKVAYVRLTGFSEGGADAFVAAVKADVAKGQKAFVVDLRGNPGGFIDAAAKVASAFVGSGPIFWQQDVHGAQTPTDAIAGGPATDPSIRVVVLVDKGSASASEIVAGALQDTKRGTLIGETSYGKGTVQTWIELDNNAGGVKLTVAKWLTPDKRWIHKVGLTPNVVVTLPDPIPAGSDPILDKGLEVLGASARGDLLRDAA